MMLPSVGSTAILPIARVEAIAALDGLSFHVSPPSVDWETPRPASESPDAFGSPVSAYSVSPRGSVGSCMSEPSAFEPSPADENCQPGLLVCRPCSVRHTPPPAVPIQTRHLPWLQV